MPTIHIADDVHPERESGQGQTAEAFNSGLDANLRGDLRARRRSGTESPDGIYNIRSRSAAPQQRRQATIQTQDDDPGLRRDRDFKQKQV